MTVLLLAQAAETEGGSSTSFWITLLIFGAVFYLLMIRPQRRRVQKQQELSRSLEVGDQVRTVGGLYGVVIGISGDSVVLGIEEGRVRIATAAIATKIDETSDEEA